VEFHKGAAVPEALWALTSNHHRTWKIEVIFESMSENRRRGKSEKGKGKKNWKKKNQDQSQDLQKKKKRKNRTKSKSPNQGSSRRKKSNNGDMEKQQIRSQKRRRSLSRERRNQRKSNIRPRSRASFMADKKPVQVRSELLKPLFQQGSRQKVQKMETEMTGRLSNRAKWYNGDRARTQPRRDEKWAQKNRSYSPPWKPIWQKLSLDVRGHFMMDNQDFGHFNDQPMPQMFFRWTKTHQRKWLGLRIAHLVQKIDPAVTNLVTNRTLDMRGWDELLAANKTEGALEMIVSEVMDIGKRFGSNQEEVPDAWNWKDYQISQRKHPDASRSRSLSESTEASSVGWGSRRRRTAMRKKIFGAMTSSIPFGEMGEIEMGDLLDKVGGKEHDLTTKDLEEIVRKDDRLSVVTRRVGRVSAHFVTFSELYLKNRRKGPLIQAAYTILKEREGKAFAETAVMGAVLLVTTPSDLHGGFTVEEFVTLLEEDDRFSVIRREAGDALVKLKKKHRVLVSPPKVDRLTVSRYGEAASDSDNDGKLEIEEETPEDPIIDGVHNAEPIVKSGDEDTRPLFVPEKRKTKNQKRHAKRKAKKKKKKQIGRPHLITQDN